VNEQVTSVRIKNNKSEICSIIEKFQSACLLLRKILYLTDNMLWILTIFHLVLRKLIVYLIEDIFCCLSIVQSLCRNKAHWRLYLLWLTS